MHLSAEVDLDTMAATSSTVVGSATRRRLPIPMYPTVLGLAFVTELYITSGVSPFSAVRVFVVALALLVSMTLLGRLAFGDPDRGAFAATLGILALMAGVDLRLLLIVVAALGLLLAERYLLPAHARTIRWTRITTLMSRLAAVAALAVTIHAIQSGAPGQIVRAIERETSLRGRVTAPASPGDPDIYMILLDGHARADVLSAHFGVDGSAFTRALEQRGFAVAPESRSSYPITTETLGSMLNMRLLSDEPRMAGLLAGTDSTVHGIVLRDVINDNAVFDELHARGYDIESISSGWEEVAMREADRFVDTGELNEFEVGMLRRSTIGDVLQAVAPSFVSGQFRSRIEHVFDATVDFRQRPNDRPVFVFSHVPSPHPPWVFHVDGSPRDVSDLEAIYADSPASTGLSLPELREAYGEQVVDIDRRLLATLDRLQERIDARGRPAVVIAFSDHGSWVDADGGDIRLRFKNLLAVKSTGPLIAFDERLTTANLFGSLFSQLFGTAWTPQPDTSFRQGPRDQFDLIAVDDPDDTASP